MVVAAASVTAGAGGNSGGYQGEGVAAAVCPRVSCCRCGDGVLRAGGEAGQECCLGAGLYHQGLRYIPRGAGTR